MRTVATLANCIVTTEIGYSAGQGSRKCRTCDKLTVGYCRPRISLLWERSVS